MLKTHKYKLYRSKKNRKLHKLCSTAGRIYNHCIALSKRYYRLYGKTISFNKLRSHIAKLRKRNPLWMELGSQTVQDIVFRIEKGLKSFFKKSIKRPPSFKKSRKYKSFTFTQAGYQLDGNKLTINSLKTTFGFHKSRDYGSPKTVTISRDNCGDFWMTIVFDEEIQTNKFKSGKTAGFDFGLKTFLTSSNGTEIQPPLFYKDGHKQIAKAQKNLSSKKKGSNNRKKARLNHARVHRAVANKRTDYQWKLANRLVTNYDVLCFEDLNMDGMKRLWGKKISDLAFSDFILKVEWLSKKHGKEVVKIDRWFPSSKTCFDCGHIVKELPLLDREWCCPECGTFHLRDLNAAKNIHREGTSSLALGNVSPDFQAIAAAASFGSETAESPLL
jgi:putative transposase